MNSDSIDVYINNIAKKLDDPNKYGPISVFVGAGFSKNAISLDDYQNSLSWEELSEKMYEEIYPTPKEKEDIEAWNKEKIKKTSGTNVLKLAEEYKSLFGRNELDKFIEKNINDDIFIPGKIHKELLKLNWNDVFTTNYDTLLEQTIDQIQINKNYRIITNQNDLPGSTHPRIIKLHGTIGSSKPYIICEEDYRTYPINYAPFVNTVKQSMLETKLLLIGFSCNDPNFLNWIGWIRDNMGDNCQSIYLCGFFSNMSISERKLLESKKINIINIQNLADSKDENFHKNALIEFFKRINIINEKKNPIYLAI